ncbi:MAG: hypothetical protein R3A48_18210 [Polyangiales bacterium]
MSADLTRLRAAPSLDRWLRARGEGDCAARLSARVERLAAVSLDGGAETLGLVLSGRIVAREVTACARESAPDASSRAVTYRGVTFTRISLGERRGGAEIDLLPGGVALVGPPWVARSLLDAGLSFAQGHVESSTLRAQWDALPPDAAVRAAWRPAGPARELLGVDALRGSAAAGRALDVTLTAVSTTDEGAVALAHRGVAWREATLPTLQSEALRGLLRGLRIRADGRAVSASISLDPARLDALWTTLGALAAGL